MITLSGDSQVPVRLKELAHVSPLSIVTPINHASVREIGIDDLLNGRPVQPHFEYDTAYLTELASRRSQIAEDGQYILDHLTISGQGPGLALDDFVKQLLQTRLQSADDLCQLAQAIAQGDDEAAGRAALRLYGVPSPEAIQMATVAQDRPPANQSREESPIYYRDYQIAECFNQIIQQYGIPGYTAEVSSAVTAVSVRDGKLCVPTGRTLKGVELARLIGHEIECHLRCRANVAALIQRVIGRDSTLAPLTPWLAKSIDESIHEGVAKISDVDVTAFLTGNGDSQHPHPWYLLGVSHALHDHRNFDETIHWFYDQLLQSGKAKESAAKTAWTRAYRLYRGMTCPHSRDYLYTKDAAYFEGYQRLQRLRTENSKLCLMALDFSSLSEDELSSLVEICQQLVISGHNVHCASGNATPVIFQPAYPHRHLALQGDTLPG